MQRRRGATGKKQLDGTEGIDAVQGIFLVLSTSPYNEHVRAGRKTTAKWPNRGTRPWRAALKEATRDCPDETITGVVDGRYSHETHYPQAATLLLITDRNSNGKQVIIPCRELHLHQRITHPRRQNSRLLEFARSAHLWKETADPNDRFGRRHGSIRKGGW
jgi:hypothetical protein